MAMGVASSGPAFAQAQDNAAAQMPATAIVPGERLSSWLQRNAAPDSDFTAFQWRAKTEQGPQMHLRSAVTESLGAQHALAQWLRRLPLTGRLPLAHADARWLLLSPKDDPVLAADQSLLLLPRPGQVAVLGPQGEVCLVAHRPGSYAKDYLQACAQSGAAGDAVQAADQVWIAQPDGRVSSFGIAPWNAQAQDEPAPGAWLWAPPPSAGITPATSSNLMRFVATQVPAEMLLPELGLAFTHADVAPRGDSTAPARNLELTASDWGEIGLLQTPTARMEPAGAIRLNISAGWPYTRATAMLQPLDWLEVGFRYTDIQNALYGPAIAGSQTYKDKSIDLKLRLREEGALWPQLAVGMRDIGGTGLFSGEYLVASKRWGNWDASLGLGWGYLGARGGISAPLGFLGESFRTRGAANVGQGGTVNTGGMFRGDAAPFGGVQWHLPIKGLILKAELDGNDYRSEPFGSNLNASSPLNWGAVYRYSPYVDFSAAWERGNRVVLGVNLHVGIDKLESPKVLDPALPWIRPLSGADAPPAQLAPADWGALAQALGTYTGWDAVDIDQQFSTLTVRLETDDALMVQERVERALVVLHNQAPPSVQRFVVLLQQKGIALSQIEVNRAEWLAQRTQAQPPSLKLPAHKIFAGSAQAGQGDQAPLYRKAHSSELGVEWGPSYSQILGGPDGFVLYEIGLQAKLDKHFSPSTWLSGNVNARLLDNYEGFKYDAPSNLPRVRTFAREYVTTARVTIPNLQLNHVADMGGGHYASLYGGLLEDMYGGVGGEWLYRHWQSPLAFGVDVNHVRQRNFAQNFAFRDYQVNTGHATLYWDTGWNDVQVKASAGQYLAGDVGATLDVRRVFKNGTALGVWATKTNVSSEQFGEGSFDKGFYLTIPFDVIMPKSAPGMANVLWQPLTRDGGARLSRSLSLFDLTRQRDARTWGWSSRPSRAANRFVTGQDTSYIEQEPSEGPWEYAANSATALGRGIAGIPASTWAWGGATVLGASLLDSNLDQWAQNHQGENWDRLTNLTNGVPYALALGSGLLFTGIAGDDAALAARSALTAAAFTLGGNVLTKYAVGRARPLDGLGHSQFDGFGSTASQSSFASNHVALAFALATPFAQQYDAPWLYGLAASTAVGRVQSREHWLSDTVAGGLLGYAIGTLTYQQQQGGKRRMRLSATPQSVNASWDF